jgi:hypothetical protein
MLQDKRSNCKSSSVSLTMSNWKCSQCHWEEDQELECASCHVCEGCCVCVQCEECQDFTQEMLEGLCPTCYEECIEHVGELR